MAKSIDSKIHRHPYKFLIGGCIGSIFVAAGSVMYFVPAIPDKVVSLLVFPFSAGSFAAIANYLFNEHKERWNLHVEILPSPIYFPYDRSDHFTADNRLLIYLRIENRSQLPIGIAQFKLVMPNKAVLNSSQANARPADSYDMEPYDGTKHDVILLKDNFLKPVINMRAYEVVEGFVFFPGCPHIENDVSFKAVLDIETTRGNIEKETTVSRYSHDLFKGQFHNI
jgi:hypothetical protein